MTDRLTIATQTAAAYFKEQKRQSSKPVQLKRIVEKHALKHTLMYVTEDEMAAVLCWGESSATGTETSTKTQSIQCGPSDDGKEKVKNALRIKREKEHRLHENRSERVLVGHPNMSVAKYNKGDVFKHTHDRVYHVWEIINAPRRFFGYEELPPTKRVETEICAPLDELVWEYENIPDPSDDNHLLIVLKDRKDHSHVVGIASFEFKEEILVLHSFCLYPEYRGRSKGISASFLAEAITRASNHFRHARCVYLLPSEMGKSLYTSAGFKNVEQEVLTDDQRQTITGGLEGWAGFGTIMALPLT